MKTSKYFYKELSAEGLSKRKTQEQTNLEINYLKKILKKDDKILDLACGYGRISLILAKKGYNISGLDITPSFIKKAQKDSKESNLKINYKIGNILKLPYKNNSFNIVLCLWSAFNEIIKENQQIISINEILRVLKKNGQAIIDMPLPFDKNIPTSDSRTIKKNVIQGVIEGIESMPLYNHTPESLKFLLKKTNVKNFKILIDNYGGRERLILKFFKCT